MVKVNQLLVKNIHVKMGISTFKESDLKSSIKILSFPLNLFFFFVFFLFFVFVFVFVFLFCFVLFFCFVFRILELESIFP